MLIFKKKVSNDLKGIIFICLASLFFSLMAAYVKFCSLNLSLIEIIFLRSLVTLIILVPILKTFKISFKTNLYSRHLVRAVIGICAMLLNFYAIGKLPLSNYSIISFAKIFFIILLATFYLKEKLKSESFFYISLGFIGIVLILGIEESDNNLISYYLCAILATLLIAIVKIFLKNISVLENNIKIQFYFSLNSFIIFLIPYLFNHSKISYEDFFNIIFLSIFGLLAQYFTIEGLKASDALKVMPFDFSRIIFSSILGIVFFSDQISAGMIFGAMIIVYAGIKLIRRSSYK